MLRQTNMTEHKSDSIMYSNYTDAGYSYFPHDGTCKKARAYKTIITWGMKTCSKQVMSKFTFNKCFKYAATMFCRADESVKDS